MCDPGGFVHFRACITSYSISQAVLKNCLAVLAVWATFALTLLVCKYRDSITYGLCYIRWNWCGGLCNNETQLLQPLTVAMISAREVEEHYLNLEDRGNFPSFQQLQGKSRRDSPPPPYDPPPAYHVALLREQQPAFVLSPAVLV